MTLNPHHQRQRTPQPDPLWKTAHAEEFPQDTLKAVLEFYDENLLLKTFQKDTTTVKHLDPQQVARALANEISLTTGILTPDILWWRHDPAGPVTAIWREPKIWKAALQIDPFQPTRRFELPMPGLIFITRPGAVPHVFATPERPTGPQHTVYNMPTFNVFSNGRICPGNHHFPTEPSLVPESFFQSFFTLTGDPRERSKSHGTDILSLWEEIDGQPNYPFEDLVEHSQIAIALDRASA